MAKITVDASLCTGCGLCESSCPEVFKMNDENIAEVLSSSCESCDVSQVGSDCPVEAIKLEE